MFLLADTWTCGFTSSDVTLACSRTGSAQSLSQDGKFSAVWLASQPQ